MNIEITESQFKKVFFSILNTLFPNITYETKYDIHYIMSDGELIGRIYGYPTSPNELFILDSTIDTIVDFIPQVSLKPKLLSKLFTSFIIEKTGLKIKNVEFWMVDSDGDHRVKYHYKK
jgi:hypothetical protein